MILSNAIYRICMFINIYSNINKNDIKHYRLLNKLILDQDYHCGTLLLPIEQFDKIVNDMGLYENDLFCIFMNIK